jgi:hypothetical protein
MPKDFEGNNQKSDFYTGDLVLKRVKGPNGTSSMAWITKSQDRQRRSGDKEAKAYIANIKAQEAARLAPPPPPPTAPRLTPILTGTVTGDPKPPGPIGPPMSTAVPTMPSWWINSAIQNPQTDDQRFANAANALLPTLSPEDQRTLATYLAQNHKEVYGGYANAKFDEAPTEMNAQIRKNFLNSDRANLAVNLLDKMRTASGGGEMGAGYDYLKNAVNLMNQFTTGGAMTREKFQQFQAAVAALGKNAGPNIGAYANLAQLFNLPSFSAGPLVSNTPNNKLFT